MSQIKAIEGEAGDNQMFNGYYLVQQEDGQLRCSCGRSLIKADENTWKCSGGYPLFRPKDGDIKQDKFGNTYFKMKPHRKKSDKVQKGGASSTFGKRK